MEITVDPGADAIEQTWLLRDTLHLSYREIAKQLGCAEGTVMSRLARARKRHGVRADGKHHSMREIIEQEEMGEPERGIISNGGPGDE